MQTLPTTWGKPEPIIKVKLSRNQSRKPANASRKRANFTLTYKGKPIKFGKTSRPSSAGGGGKTRRRRARN